MSGFVAPDLHGYDSVGSDELRLTLLRPVLYAEHIPQLALGDEGRADYGPFVRETWLLLDQKPDPIAFDALARERLWTPEHYEISRAGDGSHLQRDLWTITPQVQVVVLAQRLLNNGCAQFDVAALADTPLSIHRNGRPAAKFQLHAGEIRIIKLKL